MSAKGFVDVARHLCVNQLPFLASKDPPKTQIDMLLIEMTPLGKQFQMEQRSR